MWHHGGFDKYDVHTYDIFFFILLQNNLFYIEFFILWAYSVCGNYNIGDTKPTRVGIDPLGCNKFGLELNRRVESKRVPGFNQLTPIQGTGFSCRQSSGHYPQSSSC